MSAILSDDGRYRFVLGRTWLGGIGGVVWIMLNPSTADAEQDDPTIRRCIRFSQAWDFHRLWVANLYPLRSTDPKGIRDFDDVAALAENDSYLTGLVMDADEVVFAWGANAPTTREQEVIELVSHICTPVHLGLTKDGHPRHPLYLPKTSERQAFQVSPPSECRTLQASGG